MLKSDGEGKKEGGREKRGKGGRVLETETETGGLQFPDAVGLCVRMPVVVTVAGG